MADSWYSPRVHSRQLERRCSKVEIIITPVATEKTTLQTEKENKLTFIVHRKANKAMVKDEIEKRFDVKVESVNIMISKEGKKAVVKLTKEYTADEIAGRIGIF